MDNKELIRRLVSFDEVDVSTGFNSVSGNPGGNILYVPFLKLFRWVDKELDKDILYVTPGGMKGMGEHVTYIGMEFPYVLQHIAEYVTMRVETDVLLYSKDPKQIYSGEKILFYDDIVRNIKGINENDAANNYLGTDMWTDDYKHFVETCYPEEMWDTVTKKWNLMRSTYQTNYTFMRDEIEQHKHMLLSHVEKYIRPLCEVMTESERNEIVDGYERYR